jgi:diaminohydroxyphosphoribosylaminopyrimidine deaminase / 5-amino-6-(5-phosphoribosylamino)uracil reductase
MAADKHSLESRWMARALALARRGEARAHPNPMVGAVVVRDGRAVGEGFHAFDSVAHAEAIALARAGGRARGATLYVNLEPCCHTGRTSPCADAILAAGVRRVVAAMPDPNPAVAGKGFQKLRRGGVEVAVGEGREKARRLNEDFAAWVRRGRPLVTLKAALTLDGQLASPQANRARSAERWVSSAASRARVQRLRHAADAVLTGIGTVLADDPLLTDRTGRPRRRLLLRVVLDSRLRLPLGSRLVRSAAGDLVVFTAAGASHRRARALARRGVEVVRLPGRGARPDLRAALRELARREILNVLLEAGPELNGAALAAGLADKGFFFYAPKVLGATLPLVRGRFPSLRAAPTLGRIVVHRFGPDLALEGYFRDVYRNH